MIPRFSSERMVSVPNLALGTLLIAATGILGYAFSHYGLIAGAAIAVVPFGLICLLLALLNPANALFGTMIGGYFLMFLSREAPGMPYGTLLDGMLIFTLATVLLRAFAHKIEWRNARSGLTLVALLWTGFCFLELFNPESVSVKGWISSVRSVAFYFLLLVVLTQLVMTRFRYLKQAIIIWSLLTLVAVGKALIQKYIGFDNAEYRWLYIDGGHVTHIIYTGIRYFSVYSDAANFGAGMGLSTVIFAISALYFRNPWVRLYLLLVAAAACYGMLLSGTRSALAVPFVGFTAFIVLSRHVRAMVIGGAAIIGALIFLNFTTIGQGNQMIRRARSAFDTEDASFQVRLTNQAKLRELMVGKPFGAGLGHGGGKAKAFAPDAPLSQIPTDSWFVMMWVETGVVGVFLHVLTLLFVMGYGAYLTLFKLRHRELRGLVTGLVAGIAGVVVMAYANEVLGQMPICIFIYMSMGFIFLAPLYDRELDAEDAAKLAPLPDKQRLAVEAQAAQLPPKEESEPNPIRQ